MYEYEYSLIASSFRVLRLLSFIPNVRLILWTVIKSLEVSVHFLTDLHISHTHLTHTSHTHISHTHLTHTMDIMVVADLTHFSMIVTLKRSTAVL